MDRIINLSKLDKKSVIKKTLKVLQEGGLVVFPSDTVYGVLVDATNEKAVQKLIRFKNRPPGKAISVFVSDFKMLENQVQTNDHNGALIKKMLPGPFTVVLPSKHKISKSLESEKGTLGVRIPEYGLVQNLMYAFGKPITATSANLGGKSPHYAVESLLHQLPKEKQELIDLIVDAGKLPHNKPSTVIDLTESNLKILRKGDILFSDVYNYHSSSSSQTRKIGSFLAGKYVSKSEDRRPVVFVIQGDLGAGKTELTRGIASYLNITNIVSPTFVVYYEYDTEHSYCKKFIHADLYNVEDQEEFKHLGLEDYLKESVIMCIEWGERLGDMYSIFKEKAEMIFVEILYSGEKKREIIIKFND